MEDIVQLVGPQRAVMLFGVRLVGINADNGKKLALTVAFILVVVALQRLMRRAAGRLSGGHERAQFWSRQGIQLGGAIVVVLGALSIWFEDPSRLAAALGLVTAGLAFALQRVVTAVAGYVVILRGRTFNVGDRITMGGVRGDVIALSFTQTTIMEMGQPPAVQNADPAMWVKSREDTGRIVTVTNAKVFDEPIYNYSRDFPYILEEISLPLRFDADRRRAEEILLAAARRHTEDVARLGEAALAELERRTFLKRTEIRPRVYLRLTDNWLELTVRFLVEDHGVRRVKDAMSRDILAALEQAGIGLASATFEVVGLPPLRLARARSVDRSVDGGADGDRAGDGADERADLPAQG